jgi:hypothetical protein
MRSEQLLGAVCRRLFEMKIVDYSQSSYELCGVHLVTHQFVNVTNSIRENVLYVPSPANYWKGYFVTSVPGGG